MTTHKILSTGAAALLLLAAVPALADHHEAGAGAAYARNLATAGGHAVELMEAIPAESYGWQPMEGVRSTVAAAMHMAGANYFFAGLLGTPTPEGVDPAAIGKITDKAEAVAALRASVEHLSKAFEAVADPKAEADLFGNPATVEDVMLTAIGHVHEHLGQLIAYARANRVVPPWSR